MSAEMREHPNLKQRRYSPRASWILRIRQAVLMLLCIGFQNSIVLAETRDSTEATALVRLGDLYLDGELKPYDPKEALWFFSRAARLENTRARIRIAEMTIKGQGIARDVQRGLAQLQNLAESGNAEAMVTLGDLYARGHTGTVDPETARTNYENAAQTGNIEAMLLLSELYRYGTLFKPDPRRAYAYLKQARDAGSTYALQAMGQGLVDRDFKHAGSVKNGTNLLQEAKTRGSEDAYVALALRYKDELSRPRSKAVRIAKLVEAARAGNMSAALRLVEIYRDGYQWDQGGRTRKNTSRARAHLASVADQLPPGALAAESLLLDISNSTRRDYSELYKRMNLIAGHKRRGLMRRTLKTNPNTFVHFVQRLLTELKFYDGQANGLLTRGTIKAVNAFCASLNARQLCLDGPLSPRTSNLLIHAFDKQVPPQQDFASNLRTSKFTF